MPSPNPEQKKKLIEGLVGAGNVIRRQVHEGVEPSDSDDKKEKREFTIDLEKVKDGGKA